MRKLIVFAAACLIACSFLLTVQPASAAFSTPSTSWVPGTDDEAVTISFDFTGAWSSGDVFGIYDDGETSEKLPVLTGIGLVTLEFDKPGLDWTVSYDGNTINLGDTYNFDLYFTRDGGSIYSYEYNLDPATNNYVIDFGEGIPEIRIGNASPVPIPTAVLLLGSGLVGLAGFRRKTKT